jgi:hypothetical protein
MASASTALLITADHPSFMRPCVPTYLELSVSQLAACSFWRLHGRTICIPKVCHTERIRLACVFRKLLFISPVTRPRCKPYHRAIYLRALCYATFRMPTPCASRGFITNATLSAYHRGALPPTEILETGRQHQRLMSDVLVGLGNN